MKNRQARTRIAMQRFQNLLNAAPEDQPDCTYAWLRLDPTDRRLIRREGIRVDLTTNELIVPKRLYDSVTRNVR
jgi:hypothetical protein